MVRIVRVQIVIDGRSLFDSGEKDMPKDTFRVLAHLWCAMSDDDQAQFFEEAGAIMETWGAGKRESQMYYVARHMMTCECVTKHGRDLVMGIADQLKGDAGR